MICRVLTGGKYRAIVGLVAVAALAFLLWTPVTINVANLLYLSHVIDGPSTDRCAESAGWLSKAQVWASDERRTGFQQGILAWEQHDTCLARHYWVKYPNDARLALYVRGQEHKGNARELVQFLVAEPYGVLTQFACLNVAIRANEAETTIEAFQLLEATWPSWPEAITSTPESLGWTYSRVAGSYFGQKQYAQALAVYQMARSYSPLWEQPSIDGMIGLCYDRLGRWAEAEAYLRRAEDSFFASLAWGEGASRQQQWVTAVLAFERAAHLRPDDLRPWAGLVQAYHQLEQSELEASAQAEYLRIRGQAP